MECKIDERAEMTSRLPQYENDFSLTDMAKKNQEVDNKTLSKMQGDVLKKSNAFCGQEEPLPLSRETSSPQPYPFDALGDIMGSAAKCMYEIIEAPDAICGQSILGASAVAVQGLNDIFIDGRLHPVSLNLLSIAESGDRKSAVDAVATSPIRSHQKLLCDSKEKLDIIYNIKQEAWEEQNKKMIKKLDMSDIKNLAPPPPKPKEGIILAEEPTYEGLIELLAIGQSSLGLFSDEGGRFFNGHSMQKDHILKMAAGLSNLWDEKEVSRIRVGAGNKLLFNKRLSVHLMIQPIVLNQTLNQSVLLNQGFLNRCLMAFPQSLAGTRIYKEENIYQHDAIKRFYAVINTLLDVPAQEERIHLTLDREAKGEWISFVNSQEKLHGLERYFKIKGFLSKSGEMVLRLAGIITCVENPNAVHVSSNSIQQAISLLFWYQEELLRIYDMSMIEEKINQAIRVLEWLKAKKVKGQYFPISDI